MSKPTAIDLFCGAGGLSEGLRQAGFSIVAGNDIDPHASTTFRATHSGAMFLGGSIRDLSAEDFLDATGLQKGALDCLAGGPPCQGYSVNNHQRGMHDARSHLFKDYLRILSGLMPKWLIIENVTGILSAGEGEAFNGVLNGIKSLGYHVEAKILRAEDYGIPQERRRVVFIANRVGAPIVWPEPSHGNGLKPFTTIHEAISDLPPLKNGESSDEITYTSKSTSTYQDIMRIGSCKVFNHSAPKLSKINIDRMRFIPQGGSWRDIPFDLLPAGMQRAKRSDHTKRYGRMRWDGLSCTVLTKCDIHWGAYVHPEQDRSITVREAARIQSFPDWFKFEGPRTEQYIQVGNAVPPMLAKKVGEAIIDASKFAINGYEKGKTDRMRA